MTKSGGPAAIKGFRLQTTYALLRLLQGEVDQQFRPEGQEDLDVLDALGQPLEHVQVKAYGTALQLAHLAEQDSAGARAERPYLQRALERLRSRGTRERVVSFGPIGPELLGAWQGDPRWAGSVRTKLLTRGYTDEDVDLLFRHVVLEEVTEQQQQQAVESVLREGLTAGDVEWACNAISYWLLGQSEQGAAIPLPVLHAELSRAGRHLVEATAHGQVWGSVLRPLLPDAVRFDNPEELRQELYEGIGARLEHILAGVDVRRDRLMGEVQAAFGQERLVVLRGASGQGKSALAYRTLWETAVPAFTFEVGRLRDVGEARQVVLAVTGRMRALRVPMWLLLDVQSGDALWLEVLQGLADVRDLHVLVTVREEDWTRARSSLDLLPHAEVPLVFSEEEARPIFEALVDVRPSPEFLDFDEAWRRYEERGPLLEFVYMLTHDGRRLRARLAGQIRSLEQEWENAPTKLHFLHAAALAASTGARVDTPALALGCGLSEWAVKGVVQLLENEHLLRVHQGRVIEGLHAVRSRILLELLTSPETPAAVAFVRALPAVLEDDLELFVLNALLTLAPEEVLPALQEFTPRTWAGRVGLVRSLMWWGVRLHVTASLEVIRDAYAAFQFGWWLFLPADLLGLRRRGLVPDAGDWSQHTLFPEGIRRKARQLQARLPGEEADFAAARAWLCAVRPVPESPVTLLDWMGLAELAFYAGLWEAPAESFVGVNLAGAVMLPMEEASEVHYGLSFLPDGRLSAGRTAFGQALLGRFRKEAPLAHVADDGQRVTLHYPVPDGPDPLATFQGSESPEALLDLRLRRLSVARNLLPDRQRYACQGYGHQVALLPMAHDESRGDMLRENLPPLWGVRWNSAYIQLANLEFLLDNWTAHARHQLQRRTEVMDALERLLGGLAETRATAKQDRELWRVRVFLEALKEQSRQIETHQELPRMVVDPWGLATTTRSALQRAAYGGATTRLARRFDARHHDPYFKALRGYMGSLANFFKQAAEGMFTLTLLSLPMDRNRAAIQRRRSKGALHGLFLSVVNLRDALERLPALQAEYRARFEEHVGADALAALEARECEVLERLWTMWSEVAREPTGDGRPTNVPVGETVVRHEGRLARELRPLSEQGIEVKVLPSEERWKNEGPTLWLTMELPDTRQFHAAAEQVLRAVHRTIRLTRQHPHALQVMLHAWHQVVVIPTRAGRPWRPHVWAPSLLLLLDEPARHRWWLFAPTDIDPAQLERLGLPLWPVERSGNLGPLETLVGERFRLISRLQDLQALSQVPGIDPSALDELYIREEGRVQECEGRLQELLAPQALGRLPLKGATMPDLFVPEVWESGLAEQVLGADAFPVVPRPEDAPAADALAILVLMDIYHLQHEGEAVEALERELFTLEMESLPLDEASSRPPRHE